MKLIDIVDRKRPAVPWADGGSLPWDDPEFSKRILEREHLDQSHDRGSRRRNKIEAEVKWLIKRLHLKPGQQVLDLACGPGLYCHEFARHGIRAVGVDYSPASIKHARDAAQQERLDAEFILEDLRRWEPQRQFDAVIFVYGGLNFFEQEQTRKIMLRINRALKIGGILAAEIATENYPKKRYETIWSCEQDGFWGEFPYVCLEEDSWNSKLKASMARYYVINSSTDEIKYYSQCHQFYSKKELFQLHIDHGLRPLKIYRDLKGERFVRASNWIVLISRKRKIFKQSRILKTGTEYAHDFS